MTLMIWKRPLSIDHGIRCMTIMIISCLVLGWSRRISPCYIPTLFISFDYGMSIWTMSILFSRLRMHQLFNSRSLRLVAIWVRYLLLWKPWCLEFTRLLSCPCPMKIALLSLVKIEIHWFWDIGMDVSRLLSTQASSAHLIYEYWLLSFCIWWVFSPMHVNNANIKQLSIRQVRSII